MAFKSLESMNGVLCSCGKKHEFQGRFVTGEGALLALPQIIKQYGAKKPYVLSDVNTYRAAGEEVCRLLDDEAIGYSSFSFREERLEPNENTVGAAFMNMKADCDMIVAVGSGVINDTAKILAFRTKLPYVIVATAPSMDGYASMSSSMTVGGIKVSLPSRCADVIIGDTEILSSAPKKMIVSGVGDMLAKYISICEWRIAALICGEYYCEEIAELIRSSLRRITESTEVLLQGDASAVSALFDGLSAGSVAMNYAGISRPASGVEHYISHIIDMRGEEFGEPVELHGLQCAIGTLLAIKLYERLKSIVPDRERALEYVASFDADAWNEKLRSFLGNASEGLIALERTERKYDAQKHRARLEIILERWDEIKAIIDEELPSYESVRELMLQLGMPTDISDIGLDAALLPDIFLSTKDIRDKYVLPRLLWDLGVIDEFAEYIKTEYR